MLLRILPFVLFLALAVFFAYSLVTEEHQSPAPPPAAKRLVAIDVLAIDGLGNAPSLEALRGQFVLVNFFASWCTPCLAEHPAIKTLAEHPSLTLYGIGWNDKPGNIAAWLGKHGNPYDYAALDKQGRSGIEFGISGVPESFLLDREGNILYHQNGPLTEAIIHDTILPLLP